MSKIVVVGSKGFIGRSIFDYLKTENFEVQGFSRAEIDLEIENSVNNLADIINDGDVVVFAAAKAPVKSVTGFKQNLTILENFMNAIKNKHISYLLNISSDAVYPDIKDLISEELLPSPLGLHGAMHMTRELALNSSGLPVGHIRPTLVYGPGDPHNGYGPNRFVRQALKLGRITLIGKGEEVRDHIHISDVTSLAISMVKSRILGIVNAVTGTGLSFYEIASTVASQIPEVEIEFERRIGSMPHNGRRLFATQNINELLPTFNPIPFPVGIKEMIDFERKMLNARN